MEISTPLGFDVGAGYRGERDTKPARAGAVPHQAVGPFTIIQRHGAHRLRIALVKTRGEAMAVRDEWREGDYSQCPGVLRNVDPQRDASAPPPFVPYAGREHLHQEQTA